MLLKRREGEKRTHKMCPYMLKMKAANLFISMPHAWRSSSFRCWFFFSSGRDLYGFHRDISWVNRLPILISTCSAWVWMSWKAFLLTPAIPEPLKSSQMKRKPSEWKTTLEVELFMYDNNDVIRKKIISKNSPPVFIEENWRWWRKKEKENCFRFLIMTLLNSNFMIIFWSHTNGNKTKAMRWEMVQKRVKYIWNYSWWWFPQWCFLWCGIKHVHTVTLYAQWCLSPSISIFSEYSDWYA